MRLGDLDLKNTTEDANPLDIEIVERYKYPEYKISSHYHDIALLKLDEEISFNLYFKPACLQVDFTIPPEQLQATGWGQLGFFGDSSSHLMKADLNIVDHNTCKNKFKNISIRKLAEGIQNSSQICAGHHSGRDTCPV